MRDLKAFSPWRIKSLKPTGILQSFGIILCLLVFSPYPASSQDSLAIDSISTLLNQNKKEDSTRVKMLNDLAWEYKIHQPDQARALLHQAINLSKKINYKKGEAQAYNNFGVVETISDEYEKAIDWYSKALIIRKNLGLKSGVASLFNNIGNLQDAQGDYFKALKNYSESLLIRQELRDSVKAARAKYNMGTTLYKMGNYPESLDHTFDYLQMVEPLQDQEGIANAHNVIANNKIELERFEEALLSYEKALVIFEKLDDNEKLQNIYLNMGGGIDDIGEQFYNNGEHKKANLKYEEAIRLLNKSLQINKTLEDTYAESASLNTIGYVYKNIGSNYLEMGHVEKAEESFLTALEYLNQSFEIRNSNDDKVGLMENYNGMCDIKRRQGDFVAAKQYAEKYLSLAKKLNSEKYIQDAYKDLAKINEKQGKYQAAFRYLSSYEKLKYQRLNNKVAQENARREVLYSDKKKQDAMQEEIYKRNAKLERAAILRNSLIGGAFALLLLAALLYNRYRIKNRAHIALGEKNKIIENEKKRSDELLLNILPLATAKELKENGKAKARFYDSVTVLFTDFVAFTSTAEQLEPAELVEQLDHYFRAFDDITEKYGIEKIKTIGDAYMCACGLPIPQQNHAEKMVNAAIEMNRFVEEYGQQRKLLGKRAFEIRIGIHSGPVVAGIVGHKKFAYDIWGDTVNIAARMESSGTAGKINLSNATFELLEGQFQTEYRGKVNAKNKGLMDMYFIVS